MKVIKLPCSEHFAYRRRAAAMHMLNLDPPDVHAGVGSSTAVRPIAAKRSIQSMLGQVERAQESR